MNGKKPPKLNQFKAAVEATPDVQNSYEIGLRALKGHRAKVSLGDTSQCTGSLDIDLSVQAKYPQQNRWDYCFCYKSEVFFIEPHSANTGEVRTVIRKLQWLKDWLNLQAPEINKLKAKSQTPYYWIQSNNFSIPKTSAQYRQVVQENIKPISKLILP